MMRFWNINFAMSTIRQWRLKVEEDHLFCSLITQQQVTILFLVLQASGGEEIVWL